MSGNGLASISWRSSKDVWTARGSAADRLRPPSWERKTERPGCIAAIHRPFARSLRTEAILTGTTGSKACFASTERDPKGYELPREGTSETNTHGSSVKWRGKDMSPISDRKTEKAAEMTASARKGR